MISSMDYKTSSILSHWLDRQSPVVRVFHYTYTAIRFVHSFARSIEYAALPFDQLMCTVQKIQTESDSFIVSKLLL